MVARELRVRMICAENAQVISTHEGEDPYITDILNYLLAEPRDTREENDKFPPRTGQGGRQDTDYHTVATCIKTVDNNDNTTHI